jgi:hypothetical protein
LFELLGRSVDGLAGGGERAHSKHFDMLGVADLGMCVDHFLLGFEKFLCELSELKNFSFDKRIAQSLHRAVDQSLIWLSVFEKALPKRREG